MGLDSSDVERLVSEIHQLRLSIERQRSTAAQLKDMNRVLEEIEKQLQQSSGGSD
mgnify:CR=1 FL=1